MYTVIYSEYSQEQLVIMYCSKFLATAILYSNKTTVSISCNKLGLMKIVIVVVVIVIVY